MNRLFLKLLGLLLLANLVTAAAVFVLVRPWMDSPLSARNVQAWGVQAIAAYEDGGRAALLLQSGRAAPPGACDGHALRSLRSPAVASGCAGVAIAAAGAPPPR